MVGFSLGFLLLIRSPHLTKKVQKNINRTRANLKQQHKEGDSTLITHMFGSENAHE